MNYKSSAKIFAVSALIFLLVFSMLSGCVSNGNVIGGNGESSSDLLYWSSEKETSEFRENTSEHTTKEETSEKVITNAPTASESVTETPTTETPTTEAPTTEAPTTEAPTTEAPTTSAPTTNTPNDGNLVWIPTNGGTKYHKTSTCSKMKEPIQVTVDEAVNKGYSPCKKCYG